MKLRSVLFGAAASLVLMGSAFAADPMGMSSPGGFDWSRLYVGVLGGGWNGGGSGAFVDGVVGANMVVDNGLVLGAELEAGTYSDTGGWYGEAYAIGRLGVLANDQVLLYGYGGPGIDDGDGAYRIGMGAEIAVTNNVSIRGQVDRGAYMDGSNTWVDAAVGASVYLP
ncbi:MAG TPA: hypothetical protein VIL84_14900 [Devosiaceae bacterium]